MYKVGSAKGALFRTEFHQLDWHLGTETLKNKTDLPKVSRPQTSTY